MSKEELKRKHTRCAKLTNNFRHLDLPATCFRHWLASGFCESRHEARRREIFCRYAQTTRFIQQLSQGSRRVREQACMRWHGRAFASEVANACASVCLSACAHLGKLANSYAILKRYLLACRTEYFVTYGMNQSMTRQVHTPASELDMILANDQRIIIGLLFIIAVIEKPTIGTKCTGTAGRRVPLLPS
eukprot:6191257-Pleurochrysis_carterae.AAC.3